MLAQLNSFIQTLLRAFDAYVTHYQNSFICWIFINATIHKAST